MLPKELYTTDYKDLYMADTDLSKTCSGMVFSTHNLKLPAFLYRNKQDKISLTRRGIRLRSRSLPFRFRNRPDI
jgi:hypothetical protein